MASAPLHSNDPLKARTLDDLRTPALILDRSVLQRNLDFAIQKAKDHGVRLRPHIKTAKCAEVARLSTTEDRCGVTVSTLREAEYLLEHGLRDFTYAIGISPAKFRDVALLQEKGATVNLITDDLATAQALVAFADANDHKFTVYIDVDTGYGRSGVLPHSDALIDIARAIDEASNVRLVGVLTHAGHSYNVDRVEEITTIAENERTLAVHAADRIREQGIACPEVSVGSTPTFVHGRSFEGVTEVRPGNYMFFDLTMVNRNVCAIEDVAVSVLTTVIVTQPDRGRVLVDAGGLAMSKDEGGATNPYGYGLLRTVDNGEDYGKRGPYRIGSVSQEQGWLASMDGEPIDVSEFTIGQRLRVLPNHSCMTASAYDRYYVVDGGLDILETWERCHGW